MGTVVNTTAHGLQACSAWHTSLQSDNGDCPTSTCGMLQ
jgi:hypothetical protein